MAISFTTSASGKGGERMFAPVGAQSINGLPGFVKIKMEDLNVGMRYGKEPLSPRAGIDPKTITSLHKEVGKIDEFGFIN